MKRLPWLALAAILSVSAFAEPLPPQLSHPADGVVCQQPLGALWSPRSTTFRVFAPTAQQVQLQLRQPDLSIDMQKASDGSWSAQVQGDCDQRHYRFLAQGDETGFGTPVIDPYARCVTGHRGWGIVLADSKPLPPGPAFPLSDAIIYELHLRDFTLDPDSLIQRRGKYLGLAEPKRHLFGDPAISTGLDHLVELGINTVQIMPLCEFQNDEEQDAYGWGYDSVHFNSPEGWYSSRRHDSSRVQEFKQMVEALHQRGIRVVMDMVYNHTMEDRFAGRIYSFEGLLPGYYYRRKPDGSYFNGSGVGNEFRSEAPMARRFLIDSCRYWVEHMGVDGFRFDLMGLVDAATLRQLTQELSTVRPDLLIYGEPWVADTTPIEVTKKGTQRGQGYSVFNDDFRDALKGHVFQPRAPGFVQDGSQLGRVRSGIAGSIDSFADSPQESLNYVECHDNHTLWDRLTLSAPQATEEERKKMSRLAAFLLFTSQGVPFFQSGQEFYRSKGGEDNTYNLPDAVNMIRWSQKKQHLELFHYYQGLIQLRKTHPMFRLTSASQVRSALNWNQAPEGCLAYTLKHPAEQDPWQAACVLINPRAEEQAFVLPSGEWRLYVDGERAQPQGLAERYQGTVKLPPRSGWLLAR